MLVTAGLVTFFVRGLEMILSLRVRQRKDSVFAFLQSELRPVVDREVARLSNRLSQEAITTIQTEAAKLTDPQTAKATAKDIAVLSEYSAGELREQVKRSELGKSLFEELGDDAERVFDEFAMRFDAAQERIERGVRRNMRVVATAIALVLAVGLNIDSIFLLDSFLKNHNGRQVFLTQMDEILQDYSTRVNPELST